MADGKFSLRRLSDASDLDVASDDSDVRGWDVCDRAGQEIGEVEDLIVDPQTMKVRYLEVELEDDGQRVLVPIEAADLNTAEEEVVVNIDRAALAALPTYDVMSSGGAQSPSWTGPEHTPSVGGDTQRLTRAAEELRIGKREVQAGEVRVGKRVETERVSQPVTLEEERVVIERRPVSAETAMRADARIGEGGEIVVPVIEEEVVVDKRAVVKEELIISKERVSRTETVETDVRREEFDIDDPAGKAPVERTSGRSRTGEE